MNKIRYMLYFLLFVFSVTLNGKNPVLEKPNPPDLFCAAPTHRYIEVADGDNAYFVVDGLTCGTCHLVQIRVMGTQSWTITARNNGSDFQGIWASGLTPNTNYEYRAGTECEVTTYGPIGWFNSSGGAQNFVPTTCSDNIKNQGETGVDCGGPCEACASCNDGIQNQGETGVDCGGPCEACASCNDGIQNQGETGVDCGGPCSPCATCEDGIQNQGETGVDCGGPCTPCATCEDGIQNGNETGVDCGGNCTPCASCQDGIQNGDETGVDCGGTLCEPCPTCFDGIQNQGETGLDCGGPCEPCGTCEDGVKSPGEVGIDCGGSCTPCQCVVPTPKYVEGIDMDRGNQGYLVWSHQAITPANFHLQIRIQGSSDWYTFTNIPGESYSAGGGSYGYSVRGLSAHTIYEWRIKAFCTHADYESDWSEICQFNSSDPAGYSLCDQPCMAPQQLSVDIQESQTQSVFTSTFSWSWSGINPYAYAFLLEIREAGTPNWENNVVSQWEGTNYYPEPGYYQTSITVLGPTTMYEWRVSVKCNSEEDEWVASEVGQFTTLGGTCFDGVQNQGEEGIDCGGPSCDPCTTCFDGIQNQGEYWVDGGGPCSSVPPTPALKYVQGIVSGQAYLVWTHLPMDEPYWNGFYYTIRIRATGTEHWTEFQAISYDPEYYDFPSTFIEGDTYGFLVRGLPRNTDLEWQVRARFSDLEPSEWSEICQFNSSDPAGYSNCSLPCNAPNALYANFSPTGETFTTGLGWANLDNDPFSYLVEIREAGTTDWDNNIVSQLITNPTFWPSPGFYYAEVELQIQKIYEWRVSIKCSEEGEWIPSEVADLSTNPYSIKKPGSGIVNNNKPLGIANLAELEVFPNPASNLLNVNIPLLGSSDGLLSLLDYTGRIVIAQPINANEMSVEWDVSSLPKGLYMVQLRNQGNIKVKRIIIQ